MTAELTRQQAGTRTEQARPPYAPSWLDQLTAAIERLPGPAWLFYVLLLLALILVNHALQWMDGTLPLGAFHRVRTTDPGPLVYFLALTHYLNSIAHRALENFRPALEVDDSAYARLRYELTTLPARLGWAALGLGVAIGMIGFSTNRAVYGLSPSSSALTVVFEAVVISCGAGAAFLAFLFHTLRQLRLVSRLHRQATRLNLFQLAPVYAFSSLTAQTGIGLYFFNLFALAEPRTPNDDPYVIGLTAILVLVGTAFFVLPLQSMHRRLVEEKERLLAETHRRIASVHARLHQQVDNDRLENVANLNSAMSALITERDLLDKISTWPWKPATLQGFASSVMLPIVLWFITRYLGQYIK